MIDYITMLIAVLAVGAIVYIQIQKTVRQIDEAEQNPNTNKYESFCEAVEFQLSMIKKRLGEDIFLKDEDKKDDFLNAVSNLTKELVFIQTMHATNKNPKIWEEKLFNFLNKIEFKINEYLQNSDEINDEIRADLQKSFEKIV